MLHLLPPGIRRADAVEMALLFDELWAEARVLRSAHSFQFDDRGWIPTRRNELLFD